MKEEICTLNLEIGSWFRFKVDTIEGIAVVRRFEEVPPDVPVAGALTRIAAIVDLRLAGPTMANGDVLLEPLTERQRIKLLTMKKRLPLKGEMSAAKWANVAEAEKAHGTREANECDSGERPVTA